MDPQQYNPATIDSTSTFDNKVPTSLAPVEVFPSQRRSERHSHTSPSSRKSFRNRNMDSGAQRGGRGGSRGTRGDRRAYSNSSSSSSGQHNPNRPILMSSSTAHASKPPQPSQARISTPEQPKGAVPRVNSPVTPVAQESSFTLNGHSINETYIARPTTITSPSNQVTLTFPGNRNHRQRYSSGGQGSLPRPTMRDEGQHWAFHQEGKIKLLGIPKDCWTKQVYHALSPYGNVIRVEMETGSHSNNAYVLLQPLLTNVPHQNIRVGAALVRSETLRPHVHRLPSPINPAKTYYELNILPAKAIDFGVRVENRSMIAMRTEQSDGIQVTLNLKRKELDVQFPLQIDSETRKFRFRLPIALLSRIYKVADRFTGLPTLVIPFDSPPQFFMQKKEGEHLGEGRQHTSFSHKEKVWIDWSTWFRETDVVSGEVRASLQHKPLMNHKNTAIIDIGRWTDYRITFDSRTLTGPKYMDFSEALADHGVAIEDLDTYIIKTRAPSPLRNLLQDEISGTHPHLEPSSNTKEPAFDDLFVGPIHLSFPVRYQLDVCLTNGYLKEHSITKAFLEKLQSMEPCHALYILEKVADKQHVYYDPMDIFDIRAKALPRKVPSYCVLQRSVNITPTMMHVASPIMETSNRIIRQYAADADRFIRVKFSDEKTEGQLRTMPNDRAEAVFDRVCRAMKHGIVVAGRYYEFLAFGNSQFREHGAYFYAPTSSKSADDIRNSLGDFSHIKTVAKFGARLGQCFSTTREMLETPKIRQVPDIERNGYTFTDGVGKLSPFLAQMAAQQLGLSNAFDDPPSLFQFRLGGCKGVLALDPKITGNEVHIRPSQQKFEAKSRGLEIIRSSTLATAFFNRQIILVLSCLGIPDHVVITKQQNMLNDYETAMTDEEVAVQKLRKHIDMNQTTLTMAGMVLDGFMKSQDPFIMSLLRLWRAYTIKNLKEKARIAIDDGAFVLGCVDETGILRGHLNDPQSSLDATRDEKLTKLPEIFLQVDDASKKGHYKIVEGVCVLARNPSLHPGDLRVVRAVNVPELSHLKNVVVLPQTGDRDLANMCSGGDLDGDDYMVLWDADLIPETINVPPMDFTPEKPLETDDPITAERIGEFFVTYMKNDTLGQIAHAHLAQADFKADGVNDATCLALAELHSKAVDFPKSGLPAEIGQELRPRKWPHYMEKRHLSEHQKYHSRKILGQLYDQVQLIDFNPQWEKAFDERILNAFDLDDELLAKAGEVKASYDEAIRRLMAKHGIRTEFEAWSVFVLSHNHESRDYKFAEEFGRTMGALKAKFRETCREAAGVTSVADFARLERFIAAMYTVTAQEMETALRECRATRLVGGQEVPVRPMDAEHMPLISFPWLFPSELGKIATSSTASRQLEPNQSEGVLLGQQKHKRLLSFSETDTGIVEIETGGSHYEELLNLDFGPMQSTHKLEQGEP
ncbi:RdRP-domain-containing protein [Decorospora gaudefroyi]|uniref:RNA-dependent RNA polymerase n=1 Tax=Decorospora gaudefroyi TaxID=184978 RepID=A0A6A5KA18_9PLEO|nr:RdRP-domain-containing protein [Decorospora gaudefroyi]